MIATGIKLLMPHRSRQTALLFAALAFTGMAVAKLPLPVVLLGLAPISIAGVGLEKIIVGVIQAIIAGIVVMPLARASPATRRVSQ